MGRSHAQLGEDVVAFEGRANFQAVLFVGGRTHDDVHPSVFQQASSYKVGEQTGAGVVAAGTGGVGTFGLGRGQSFASDALVDVEVAAASFLGHLGGEGAGVLAVFFVGD